MMSPKIMKFSSCSTKSNDDIEEVIDKLMNDVCSSESTKRHDYNYVKILKKQQVFLKIINILYYIFSKYNIIEYQRFFKVKCIFCLIDRKVFKLQSSVIILYDNCFELDKKLKIPYEYIKNVSYVDQSIEINLIPNERNITKLFVNTTNDKFIFNKISSNMNYHMRYHQLNKSAVKYYQKFNKKPLELY